MFSDGKLDSMINGYDFNQIQTTIYLRMLLTSFEATVYSYHIQKIH